MDPETIKTLITVLISAGGAAFVKEVFSGIIKLRQGKPAREGTRRIDIISQRDMALTAKADFEARTVAAEAKADAEEQRADSEAHKRRLLEEYGTVMRRLCIDHGIRAEDIPAWPVY